MARKDAEYGPGEGGKTSEDDVAKAVAFDLQKKARNAPPDAGAGERMRRKAPFWSRGVRGLLGGVKASELFSYCHALALLLDCGLPLVKALMILSARLDNLTMARASADMAKVVEEGRSFSDATARHPRIFSPTIVSMLRAGERSGKLSDMLTRISERGERIVGARRKLLTLLVYPALVVVVAIIVVAVVFGILAKGFTFFTEMGVTIPWTMKTLLNIGNALRSGAFWAVVAIILFGVPFLYMFLTWFQVFRLLRDRFLLRLPGLRHFIKEDLLANFGQVFSLMLHSGLSVQDSLQAAYATTRNEVARLTIERVQEAVRRGQRITPALERGDIFPVLAYDLCAAGEEAGALDRVFAKLGDYYEEKLIAEAAIVGKLIQPFIVILLALIVGFIVISFFQMYTGALMQLQAQSAVGV